MKGEIWPISIPRDLFKILELRIPIYPKNCRVGVVEKPNLLHFAFCADISQSYKKYQ